MGTTPRLGDALQLPQRAAAFDSQREASVRSADRHAPNHIVRTGKARRITSLDRSRSGRQAVGADAPATTSASAPRPRCFTRSRSSVTLQGSIHRLSPPTETSRRRLPMTAAPTRVKPREPSRGSSPRQSTRIVRQSPFARRQGATPNLPQSRAAPCSERSRVSSDAPLFQTSNGTRDKPASGTQYQKPDRQQ